MSGEVQTVRSIVSRSVVVGLLALPWGWACGEKADDRLNPGDTVMVKDRKGESAFLVDAISAKGTYGPDAALLTVGTKGRVVDDKESDPTPTPSKLSEGRKVRVMILEGEQEGVLVMVPRPNLTPTRQ